MKRIKLYNFRLRSLIGVGAFMSGALSFSQNSKPNVLFICVDDLNSWIGPLNGHPGVKTPNIDRLAMRGVTFANAYCQAPISGPSRASLMTGLYPSTSGIYFQIPDEKIKENSLPASKADFMPDYFEKFGYKTMGAGKLFHEGDAARVFDEYGGAFGIYGPKPPKPMNYSPSWFGKPEGTATDWGAYPEREEEMPDYKTTEWVISKLKQKHDKPFFLAAGLVRPHVPWCVPQKWFNRFPVSEMITPPYDPDDMQDVPLIGQQIAEMPTMPSMDWVIGQNKWREMVQAYLACIAFMDSKVGALLKAVDESEYRDNTIIVLFGDNGYHMGEKGRFAKQSLWCCSCHVPLIFAGPGITKGVKCSANVGLIDIYPTLTDLCRLPHNQKNEGRSIVPLLKNAERVWPFATHTVYGRNNHGIYWKKYHYIQYMDGSKELYNLMNDLNEWHNLAKYPRFNKLIRQMQRMLPKVNVQNVPGSENKVNSFFETNN